MGGGGGGKVRYFSTLNVTIMGRLCEVAVNPYSNQQAGGGGAAFYPLTMPVTVVQPGFIYTVGPQSEGAKRPSGGRCAWEGGREMFFDNSCMKTAFSCTFSAIIRR